MSIYRGSRGEHRLCCIVLTVSCDQIAVTANADVGGASALPPDEFIGYIGVEVGNGT